MNKKAIAILSCGLIATASLTACGSSNKSSSSDSTADTYLNYTAPVEGEDIVTISVEGMGDIKIKLFSDLLPEACENFTTHASDGYYDGLIFHRVIDDFMIQGGDPNGTGTGGSTIDSLSGVDMGTSDKLLHLTGAVAYANSGSTATNGSQFYIVTGLQPEELTDDYFENLKNYGVEVSDEAKELYQQYGGYPYLDGSYTVFGQVIDGLDIAYDIAATTDKNDNDKPTVDIVMDSVTVSEYDGSDIKWYKSDYSDIDK
jgi:cyclophilin family peptidyl-prolyl cis-trans isomerase